MVCCNFILQISPILASIHICRSRSSQTLDYYSFLSKGVGRSENSIYWHLLILISKIIFETLLVGGSYLLTLPLFAGVSRVRALSPAWTRSHARETLISRTPLFLPHDIPPTKKSSTIKSWPTFCDQYFWKFPIWNSRTDEKHREIRM